MIKPHKIENQVRNIFIHTIIQFTTEYKIILIHTMVWSVSVVSKDELSSTSEELLVMIPSHQ